MPHSELTYQNKSNDFNKFQRFIQSIPVESSEYWFPKDFPATEINTPTTEARVGIVYAHQFQVNNRQIGDSESPNLYRWFQRSQCAVTMATTYLIRPTSAFVKARFCPSADQRMYNMELFHSRSLQHSSLLCSYKTSSNALRCTLFR